MPASADAAFAWHERPGAFERLNPPWSPARVVAARGGIAPGGELVIRVPLAGPMGVTWVAQHRDWRPGREFRDVQARGPFAHFDHRHIFEPVSADTSVMHDRIDWRAPGGAAGGRLLTGTIARDLARVFAYRHRTLRGDLAAHARWRDLGPLRVAISGATGLVGRALAAVLSTGGHAVERLERAGRLAAPDIVLNSWPARAWDVPTGLVQWGEAPPDAIVHLAGASVAARRWSASHKALIRSSRVDATRALCEQIARVPSASRPRVLLCASAIGVYDKTLGDRPLDEHGPSGDSFLAEVCRAWEGATRPAEEAGVRVVHLRLGVILSPLGGALGVMLPVFRLGLGGPLGTGRQWLSWIGLDDVLDATLWALRDERLRGSVNLVAPEPVRQADFALALGAALGRPAILPAPAWALRALAGGIADGELLTGVRVMPRRLLDAGFTFRQRYLGAALRHMLGRDPAFDR
jgi:uncharacterized protein (TIGR01777 family)